MCEPVSLITLGVMAVGAVASADAAKKNSKANKAAFEHGAAVDRHKADIYDRQADDAISRGQSELFSHRLKASQLKGAQRARFAAAGMDLNEGSAFNVLMDTDYMTDIDARTIEDNAESEAWTLRENAKMTRQNAGYLSGRAGAENPNRAAATSLLSSAGTVASSWYRMSGTGGGAAASNSIS